MMLGWPWGCGGCKGAAIAEGGRFWRGVGSGLGKAGSCLGSIALASNQKPSQNQGPHELPWEQVLGMSILAKR